MKKRTQPLATIFGEAATNSFSASLSEYLTDHKQSWHSHNEFDLAMILRGNVREEIREKR